MLLLAIRESKVATPALCMVLLLVIAPATKLPVTLMLLTIIAVLTTSAFRVAVPALCMVVLLSMLANTALPLLP